MIGAVELDAHAPIRLTRSVLADDFDEPTIARTLRVGDDNAVHRIFLAAVAAEADVNCLTYRLKRPRGDGRQMLLLQSAELLRRLATLVPPPRAHLVRYHGVFAPASRWRSQVIPPLPERAASAPPCNSAPRRSEDMAPAVTEAAGDDLATARPQRPAGPSRIPWAELLLRVFREDVLLCPCGGRHVCSPSRPRRRS